VKKAFLGRRDSTLFEAGEKKHNQFF